MQEINRSNKIDRMCELRRYEMPQQNVQNENADKQSPSISN